MPRPDPTSESPTDANPGSPTMESTVARDWRVEVIDCEAMTNEQHRAAVRALAALITEWRRNRHTNPHSAR